jgi:DNA-binding MarR family transcriptional regulator
MQYPEPLLHHKGITHLRGLIQALVGDSLPDLTARQFAIVLIISTEVGSQTVRDLSERLKVQKPAITRAIDALENFGYAQRVADEANKRSVDIWRTEKGVDYVARVAHFMDVIDTDA